MMEDLGMHLKELRSNLGMTQKEMSEKVGVARSTYALYETNRIKPPLDVYFRMVELYPRTIDALIRHKWPEEKPEYDQENPKKYLVLDCTFEKASYHPDGYFWTFDCGQEYVLEDVSYWWNLPEVTE